MSIPGPISPERGASEFLEKIQQSQNQDDGSEFVIFANRESALPFEQFLSDHSITYRETPLEKSAIRVIIDKNEVAKVDALFQKLTGSDLESEEYRALQDNSSSTWWQLHEDETYTEPYGGETYTEPLYEEDPFAELDKAIAQANISVKKQEAAAAAAQMPSAAATEQQPVRQKGKPLPLTTMLGKAQAAEVLPEAPLPERYKESKFQELTNYIRQKYPDFPIHDYISIETLEAAGKPCHFAVEKEDWQLLELLILAGANPYQLDEQGKSIYDVRAAQKPLGERYVQTTGEAFLIDPAVDEVKRHVAEAFKKKDEMLQKIFIASTDADTMIGATALEDSVKRLVQGKTGDVRVIDVLINTLVDAGKIDELARLLPTCEEQLINWRDPETGKSLLHLTVEEFLHNYNSIPLLRKLSPLLWELFLSKSLPQLINAQDKQGRTALYIVVASKQNNTSLIKALLDNGADKTIPAKTTGKSPADLVNEEYTQREELLKTLKVQLDKIEKKLQIEEKLQQQQTLNRQLLADLVNKEYTQREELLKTLKAQLDKIEEELQQQQQALQTHYNQQKTLYEKFTTIWSLFQTVPLPLNINPKEP